MGSFNRLLTTTVREFDGGLNVVNNDLNMSTRFSKIETNVYNNLDGSKSKRYGTKYFIDLAKFEPKIENYVNCEVKKTKTLRIEQDKTKPFAVSVGSYPVVIRLPEELVGEYKVIFSNQDYFEIEIDAFSADPDDSSVTYLYRSETEERISKNNKITKQSLLKLIKKGYSDLLIGQKVTINTPPELQGEYSVVKRDNEAYYLDISSKTEETMIPNVIISHNNQRISGKRIINGEYFIDRLVLVSDLGEVVTVDGKGNANIIWNDNIAKSVNKEEGIEGWHETSSVCFTVFNGILTIWNGRDKPLAVDLFKNIPCNYLIDEGTGSNANVPIAKYALAFNHYLVAANIYDELEGKYYPDRISISAKDTIGTFYSGDDEDVDNDGVYVDLGKIISSNKQAIKGLSRYRNQVAVGFDDVTVFGTLGHYEDATRQAGEQTINYKIHVPSFEDVVDNHGCISNRTYFPLQSELICLDYSGLPDFRRGNLTSQVIPSRISTNIAPELYATFKDLKEKAIEERIFAVYNPKENQYLLFIPDNSEYSATKEYICYAYTLKSGSSSSARDGAWSKFIGWNFQYGITTALNEVFLGNGTKLYVLGNIDRQYFADFIGDPDYPPENEEDLPGKAIDFELESPWTDFGDRAAIKKTRYLALSTNGDSPFYVDFFVDYIYTNKETGEKDPQLRMDFVGGDSNGWGGGSQLYGAGRRTNTEFLFAWTTTYKIAKFNLHGSSKRKINLNSITIYYQRGNIRR